MDKKKLMLLMGALVIAIGTALAARSLIMGASAPKAEAIVAPKGPKVLVAQRALPVGTIITADAFAFQEWPKEMVQDAYFIDGEADMSKLLGTVVRFPITAGQPLTQGALVSPGDRGFLAAALGPGMRAVTISVSARTGVGGFVFPGDHVDLVMTQAVGGSSEGNSLKTAETFLRNLRVLATDQSTESETVDGKTVVRAFRTVTLEVTPRIAEEIAVAETIGSLSLSLRSLADNQAQLDQAIASGAVKVPAGASKAEEDRILNQVANRPQSGFGTFVTGGDVSRFQPRSVQAPRPAQPQFSPPPRSYAPSPGANGSATPAAPRVIGVRVTRGKTTVVETPGAD
jgi:pilus assembly protein CpaB